MICCSDTIVVLVLAIYIPIFGAVPLWEDLMTLRMNAPFLNSMHLNGGSLIQSKQSTGNVSDPAFTDTSTSLTHGFDNQFAC